MMCGNTTKCVFVKVEASKLCLDDEFMQYQPKTKEEREFKEMVEKAIRSGLKDFWRPKYDPSFSEDGTSICYVQGKKPAVGKSFNWWAKTAKELKPEQGSRLGTKSEYIAFLAVLIKELVTSGKPIEWAWNAVCNDSKELGYCCNSAYNKRDFESTGSREICGWYDLGNIYKILAEDKEVGGYWFVGSHYNDGFPLADLCVHSSFCYFFNNDDGCGWLVFDSCPDC